MRYMKYIVVHYDEIERMFIFPEEVSHREFADHLLHDWVQWTAVRAGFVMLAGGKLVCYGSSESLRLCSDREKDSRMLRLMLDQDA